MTGDPDDPAGGLPPDDAQGRDGGGETDDVAGDFAADDPLYDRDEEAVGVVDFADAREKIAARVVAGGKPAGAVPPPKDPPARTVLGFDPEAFNKRYAVVIVGGRTMILDEVQTVHDKAFYERHAWQDRIRYLSVDAFEKFHANRLLYDGEKDRMVAETRLWLAAVQRRTYEGVMFEPDGVPDGYYNLYQGFSVAPSTDGSWDLLKEHMLLNVCGENTDLYDRLFAWFAAIVQDPGRKIEVAMAIRGKQGCGKTLVGRIFGYLLGPHWRLVDNPRYVTGQFNAHMAQLLLLQADEGFWAGSKEAEGHLKGLISSDVQFIEPKGIDAIPVSNHMRLLVTSNEDWVVPAAMEERRWIVLDCGDGRLQDAAFFQDMMAEMQAGGYARLLHDLLEFDLSSVNLRDIPQTAGLLEQKIRSLSPEVAWWYECLWKGAVTGEEWKDVIESGDVEAAYVGFCERRKYKSTRAFSHLVKYVLERYVPGLGRTRLTRAAGDGVGTRPRAFVFPDLEACRQAFSDLAGGGVDWEGSVPYVPEEQLKRRPRDGD